MKRGLCLLALLAANLAAAQTYPAKPIRMIVGYPAGGGADELARLVGAKLAEALGQPVLIDRRPGAGTTLAAAAAASAPPDGYTIFFADSALLIAPSSYANLGFDVLKSFAPVGGACSAPLVIAVNPSLEAHSVAELVKLLKADPGRLAYGSPGIGTVSHLAMETFERQAGVSLVHIPYKGAAAILPDLVSGQIHVGILSAPPAAAQAKDGRLRPLALTRALPGFDASPRLFILAPAGTPEAVVEKLNAALKTALSSKDLLESLARQGASADWTTPRELASRMAQQMPRWAQAAKDAGIRAAE